MIRDITKPKRRTCTWAVISLGLVTFPRIYLLIIKYRPISKPTEKKVKGVFIYRLDSSNID
jgi:hypothetical protein